MRHVITEVWISAILSRRIKIKTFLNLDMSIGHNLIILFTYLRVKKTF